MKCHECRQVVDKDDAVCSGCGAVLSVPEDTMDAMVNAASIPNLGALFKAAQDKGLIEATVEYSNGV